MLVILILIFFSLIVPRNLNACSNKGKGKAIIGDESDVEEIIADGEEGEEH